MPKTYSADLVKVLGQMIRVNPRERPTSAQLLELPEVRIINKNNLFMNYTRVAVVVVHHLYRISPGISSSSSSSLSSSSFLSSGGGAAPL
jgi:hypothetical protein